MKNSMNEGWICPNCGRGISPMVSYCDCSNKRLRVDSRIPDTNSIPDYTQSPCRTKGVMMNSLAIQRGDASMDDYDEYGYWKGKSTKRNDDDIPDYARYPFRR